jgi:hypothetical protein
MCNRRPLSSGARLAYRGGGFSVQSALGPIMKKLFAAVLFAAVGSFSQAAVAGPAVTTEWIEAKISLDNCKSRVSAAIRSAGIKDVDPKQFTVFAHAGDYTLAIRCMPDQGVVFFIASGPRLQQADKLLDDVLAAYRR